MSEQTKLTHDELAELIVKDVRRHKHCEEFQSISLNLLEDGQIPGANWDVASANYGGAGDMACNAALREIIPRMQRQYRLVER